MRQNAQIGERGEEMKDCVVVGGGIVGLSVAWQLVRSFPGISVLVVEKEEKLAQHQSGRNSGVIHSGIYYAPKSLKAINCLRGKVLLEEFCRGEGIPFEICGKLIVATDRGELPRLEVLRQKADAHGLRYRVLSGDQIAEVEPHVRGIRALHLPETGVVDFREVATALGRKISESGGSISLRTKVLAIRQMPDALVLETDGGEVEGRFAVNCAGLHSDRIYAMAGESPDVAICPFRGEYYLLKQERAHLCRALIYPVPDPNFPFLGVHFTRRIDGSVDCGPNAVLALAREGYRRSQMNGADLMQMASFRGLHRFLRRHWRMGMAEIARSLSKKRFVDALARMVPEITAEDVIPTKSGIRAQAIRDDGSLVDDFLIRTSPRMAHLLNAPSPAATSCLSIAETLVRTLPGFPFPGESYTLRDTSGP